MYSEFWHNQEPKEIESLLKSDLKKGLTERESISRKGRYGTNELPKNKTFI
jgi:magnesium-transporting ATPase (P-type)